MKVSINDILLWLTYEGRCAMSMKHLGEGGGKCHSPWFCAHWANSNSGVDVIYDRYAPVTCFAATTFYVSIFPNLMFYTDVAPTLLVI